MEDLSLLLIGLTSLSTLEASRTISLLLSCAAILVTDYRLAVKGLVPCILGMLFAGIAATLRRVANTYDPEDIPTRSVEFRRYVAVGYVVAIIWPVCFPDEVKYFSYDLSLDLRTICVLLLHGLSSTLSYWVGRSLISPSIEPSASDHGSEASLFPSLPDAATLLGVAGLVGNGTMLVAHRSFTSWPQYLCFAVAVLSISCGRPSLIGAPDVKSSSGGTTYELVELDPLISPREIESGASEGSVTPRAIPARSDRASSWFLYARSQLTSAIMIVLWTSFAIQNFSGQAIKSESVSFDKDYKAGSQMNVVISMYKEPVEDVRQLIDLLKSEWMDSDPDFTIYVKDEDADIENIRHRLGVKRIIPRPNVGRESETYLYHILNNWDNLAFRTTFIQADVHNPREFTPRIKLFDARRTGFLNLSWQDLCECGSCGDKFFWHDNTGLFPKIHDQIHSNGCNYMSIGYKGQFVVSAARIRGINKSIYNDLWQGFVNESSWAHQPEFLQGRADSMNAPHLGYTLERMWNLLFQCSDSNVAWKCSSLLSGHRIGGGLGDCQCFD